MSRVLLIRPPGGPAAAEELTYEHLGLGYLAAYLEHHGIDVDVCDAVLSHQSPTDIARLVAGGDFALAGITVGSQLSLPSVSELSATIKREKPETHICIGGHFPTQVPEPLIRDFPHFDSVVRGEGERPLLELVNRVLHRQSLAGVPGLTYRDNGALVSEPLGSLIDNLDELPFPRRGLAPNPFNGVQFATLVSSRGCSYKCTFCSIHAFYDVGGTPWRWRSVENVADELLQLRQQEGCKGFFFADDNFLRPGAAGLTRATEFAQALRARELDDFTFIALMTPNAVNDEVIRQLVDVGLKGVFLGVESASPAVLKRLRKPATPEVNSAALRILGRHNLDVTAGFIMFDPDTTVADVRTNIAFLREHLDCICDTNLIGKLEVYAGTPVHADMQAQGRLLGTYLAPQYEFVDEKVTWIHEVATGLLGDWSDLLEEWSRGPRGRLTSPIPASEVTALWRQRAGFMLDLLGQITDHVDTAGRLPKAEDLVARLAPAVDSTMTYLTQPLGLRATKRSGRAQTQPPAAAGKIGDAHGWL